MRLKCEIGCAATINLSLKKREARSAQRDFFMMKSIFALRASSLYKGRSYVASRRTLFDIFANYSV
jgi:hypothetical protein